MIPISKYILNREQKRAALVSCTLFAFMGFLISMPFLSLVCNIFGITSYLVKRSF